MHRRTIVLGGGVSGLGAARSSGLDVFEAASRPGGVCHSYYRDVGGALRDPETDDVSNCFRFEPAGGHWLFGLTAPLHELLKPLCKLRRYTRAAAVFFPEAEHYVPFPLQENLRYLDLQVRKRVLDELSCSRPRNDPPASFKDWLLETFGPTLCQLFFFPFNERYTAGHFDHIAPQDGYKSPLNLERVHQGASGEISSAGYNCEFFYPEGGLNQLISKIAASCRVHLGHRVRHIDTENRMVWFENGSRIDYERIISSVPLHRMLEFCALSCSGTPDPTTAVLVVNIAGFRGDRCPPYHWVYVPTARSGLHRVGFYSHVDPSFLPQRHRDTGEMVSIYAERSFPSGLMPVPGQLEEAREAIVDELREWGYIQDVVTMDITFTDPAYTWSWPGSNWVAQAIQLLANRSIHQIGRFGAWRFQGIAASFAEGIAAGREHAS